MKKQILIIILSVFVLLLGCSYSKQNKSIENIDVNTIIPGKYIGEPYNITSSFIPVLSFDNNNKFIFELGINNTIEGTYTIYNNKLVLNTNGCESYTLEITEHSLKTKQEIPNVKKNTNFKLLELPTLSQEASGQDASAISRTLHKMIRKGTAPPCADFWGRIL